MIDLVLIAVIGTIVVTSAIALWTVWDMTKRKGKRQRKHDALDEFIPDRVASQNQMRQQDALEDDYYGKPTPIIKARELIKQGE
jgi:hypothetical protein